MSEKFLYETLKNKNADFNVWMVFPGIYSFSMSSLGYLWMCKDIDLLENINLERICTDTKTTKLMLKDIDLIGFSFSFDLDFLNIFKILDKHKIPLKASGRNENHPLIFGGGPVLSSNPEPFCEFFDFIIIGDGESINIEAIKSCYANKNKSKQEILRELTKIEGIYVPSVGQEEVKKISCTLSECIFTPILSEKSFFKNTFIMEIARGCSNRCGFCLASYLNLPQRFAEYEKIIESIELGLKHTNNIALLGALISSHPKFEDICEYIYKKSRENPKITLSVSSLRADSIEPNIVKTLVTCGQKHSTIAIEAGSDRLRKVINKNLTQEQIIKTVEIAEQNGLKGLKIYAMIGLPTETYEDLKEMVNLVKKIKNRHKSFSLSFSFSTFVPKPHTPFQWCAREDTKSLEKKQNYLKKEFHKLGVKAAFSSAKWDYYQALLSRGGRELCDYVLKVYQLGGNIGAFKTAYKQTAEMKGMPDSDFYTLREYNLNENLPWDFIQVLPGKEFLKKEYMRLLVNNQNP
ncbi:MAG: radical SAM protein [Candidatus Gastranaerophilales bacterium]|nr:radical SAM protein [Candidatus Gastranaerophilales bacterium]